MFDHFDAEVQCDELAGLYEERCRCGGAQLYSEMCLACQDEINAQEDEKEARDAAMRGWDDDVIYADEYADERDFGIDG